MRAPTKTEDRIELDWRPVHSGGTGGEDWTGVYAHLTCDGLEEWHVLIPASGDRRADVVTVLRQLADDLEAKGAGTL